MGHFIDSSRTSNPFLLLEKEMKHYKRVFHCVCRFNYSVISCFYIYTERLLGDHLHTTLYLPYLPGNIYVTIQTILPSRVTNILGSLNVPSPALFLRQGRTSSRLMTGLTPCRSLMKSPSHVISCSVCVLVRVRLVVQDFL